MTSILSSGKKNELISVTSRVDNKYSELVIQKLSNGEVFTTEELEFLAKPTISHKWYQWFSDSDSKEERILITKLDLLVWLYLFLSLFVKTLDSTAVSYSYASGMKEDLKMYGNELTYQGSVYMAGFIFGQIPLTMLGTKFPLHIYLPVIDSIWAFFTLAMYKISNYHQLYALRFCIGLLGSFFFPFSNYIMGCFYTKSEVTRRSALYFIASQIGSIAGGFIQARAYISLNGKNGIAGWRWLYIIAFVISLPIFIYGYFTLPNINLDRSRLFTKKEIRLSQLRMIREGRLSNDEFSSRIVWKTITGWKFLMLVFFAIFFSQADGISSNNGLLLWLTKEGYSSPKVTTITTVIPAVTIVASIINGIIADAYTDTHPYLISFTAILNIISGAILVKWTVSNAGILVAFFLSGTADGIAAVLYSWANIICSDNSQERALTLATMNTLGNTFSVWVPLFVWKTVDGPRYLKGYAYNIALDCMMLVLLFPLTCLYKRQKKIDSEKLEQLRNESSYIEITASI